MVEYVTHNLFGGHLKITLPSMMRNMSDLVPIPDHQEVFQEMSQPSVGILIIEINEPTKAVNPAKFYFDEIAESNNTTAAGEMKILRPLSKSQGQLFSHEIVTGKHKSGEKEVKIRMGLLRFDEPYKTDIVVHMRSEDEEGQDENWIDEFFCGWVQSVQADDAGMRKLLGL